MAQMKHGGGSGHNESINAELYANMDEAVNQLNALPHSQW